MQRCELQSSLPLCFYPQRGHLAPQVCPATAPQANRAQTTFPKGFTWLTYCPQTEPPLGSGDLTRVPAPRRRGYTWPPILLTGNWPARALPKAPPPWLAKNPGLAGKLQGASGMSLSGASPACQPRCQPRQRPRGGQGSPDLVWDGEAGGKS